MPILTASITVADAFLFRERVINYLREVESRNALDEQTEKEFETLFDRLGTAIVRDNRGGFRRIGDRELGPLAIQAFEGVVIWTNITFHEQSKKFRRALH